MGLGMTYIKHIMGEKRTINSLLEYHFTEEEKQALTSCWIANWIGGEWHNIEKTILALVEQIPWYDPDKAQSLVSDIKELSIEHDTQFRLQLWFYLSNYKFAKKLYYLTNWGKSKRFLVFLWVLYTLNKYGKPFYNR